MTPQEIFDKIKSAFDANPLSEVLFITSDGQAFHHASDAGNHGDDLLKAKQEGGYRKIFREQLSAVEAAMNEVPAEPIVDVSTSLDMTGETVKQVLDLKLNKMNKVDLQAKATELGIEFTEDTIKADLISAIEAKLAEANTTGNEQ